MNIATIRDTGARAATMVLAGALVLALAGCASGTEEVASPGPEATAPADAEPTSANPDSPAPSDAEPVDDGGEGVDGGSVARLGTITIGTKTYDVVESINCEPDSGSDLVTRVLDVTAVARSAEGEDALFFAYTDEQSGVASNYIDYQGPEGTLMTYEGNATFVLEGDSLSGAGALVDDGNTQTVMAQFNFTVPEELMGC